MKTVRLFVLLIFFLPSVTLATLSPTPNSGDTETLDAVVEGARIETATSLLSDTSSIPTDLRRIWRHLVRHADYSQMTEPHVVDGFLKTDALLRVPFAITVNVADTYPVLILVGVSFMDLVATQRIQICEPRFEVYLDLVRNDDDTSVHFRINLLNEVHTVEQLDHAEWVPVDDPVEKARQLAIAHAILTHIRTP
jgi:hypothetical protein